MARMLSSRERTSVIVIRIWHDRDNGDGLRARITAVRDIEADDVDTIVAADIDEILETVQQLVNDFTNN
jgi:hypothetical protein